MSSAPESPVSRVSILWATVEHAARIAQLHGQLFDEPWSEKFIRDLCHDQACSILLATDGRPDQIIGFIITRVVSDEGEILSIGVAQPYQRFGVGKRLLEAARRVMVNSEVTNLYLEVAADNEAAKALYLGSGFSQTSVRKDYYRRPNGETSDALVLALAPGSGSP